MAQPLLKREQHYSYSPALEQQMKTIVETHLQKYISSNLLFACSAIMKIIISGSSSGIGRAITLKLLELGHEVIGLARNHQKFNPRNSRYLTLYCGF